MQQNAHDIVEIITLAHRRQQRLNAVEAVIQIFAEFALGDARLQIEMGGRNNADIHFHRAGAAHRQHFALGEHAQEPRLQIKRHIADFVEKKRAAVGRLNQADFAFAFGAGKAARGIAVKLAFNQIFGNGGAVYRNKRRIGAAA